MGGRYRWEEGSEGGRGREGPKSLSFASFSKGCVRVGGGRCGHNITIGCDGSCMWYRGNHGNPLIQEGLMESLPSILCLV